MKKQAFTLIEILVAVSIIAILVSIAIPVSRSFIENGNSTKCLANLRDLGVQINAYAADNGYYPKAYNNNPIWKELQTWSGITNSSTWLCPDRFIKTAGNSTFTPAYSANARVFNTNGLRVAAVPRPSQVIALIDAGQRSGTGWAFHQMSLTPASAATDPANADTPLTGKPITEPNADIATDAACVRYRHQGSANALFVDGHVESKKIGTILEKNISVSY